MLLEQALRKSADEGIHSLARFYQAHRFRTCTRPDGPLLGGVFLILLPTFRVSGDINRRVFLLRFTFSLLRTASNVNHSPLSL